jgi:xanthine dehydrogenase accessory factor
LRRRGGHHRALDALQDRKSRVLTFGVSDETAFAAGLACGGTIRVLVEPVGDGPEALPEAMLTQLTDARAAARALAIVTRPEGWTRQLVAPGQDQAVDARLKSDRSGMEEDGRFIAVHNPPLRLIVIGAVHIAQPLLQIARTCGYAPTLIDPRGAFGSADRFPGETILDDWPDEALVTLAPDARTAIVTLTHDPKLDDPAIRFALNSPAFYLGCLGSTRTHAKRVDRLTAEGFTPGQIAKIHAPVGLDIGAKTPAEIAVSIIAQITETLRK